MKILLDFFLVGGILITSLIIILLAKSKKRELPQLILIFFFSSLLALIINNYAELHEIPLLYIITFNIADTTVFLAGPILLLYVKSLFNESENLIKKNLFHFTIAVIYFFIISIPILYSMITDKYLFQYIEYLMDKEHYAYFTECFLLIIYLIISLKMLSKYRKVLKFNYSNLNEKDFNWVKNLLAGSLLIIILDLLLFFYQLAYGETNWDIGQVVSIILILFITYLGYYGIKQSKVLIPEFLIQEKLAVEEKPATKVNISLDECKLLKEKLEEILITKKPYLDDELTLNKLASLIPTTDKKLSALLNQYMDTTFYDLINSSRVEAVKKKIICNEFKNYTLLGIAFECGFKSKTSFNRIFKKETGLSPSEFKNSVTSQLIH